MIVTAEEAAAYIFRSLTFREEQQVVDGLNEWDAAVLLAKVQAGPIAAGAYVDGDAFTPEESAILGLVHDLAVQARLAASQVSPVEAYVRTLPDPEGYRAAIDAVPATSAGVDLDLL